MALREEMERQGGWLFRWRSFLPLALIPILVIALAHSRGLERVAGPVVNDLFQALCVIISFVGLAVRGLTVAYIPTSITTRNRRVGQEDDLRTAGMYSIVRHPLYLGNFIIVLGISLFIQVWWFVVIAVLAFWLYYERIMLAEEGALRQKFGDAYMEWAERTPAFLPRLKNWQAPGTRFHFRSILKKEYTGFFEITAAFAILETLGHWMVIGKLDISPVWMAMPVVGFVAYVTLRTLKKKTRLLEASD